MCITIYVAELLEIEFNIRITYSHTNSVYKMIGYELTNNLPPKNKITCSKREDSIICLFYSQAKENSMLIDSLYQVASLNKSFSRSL